MSQNLQQHLERIQRLALAASKEATLAIRVPAANRLRATVINRIVNEGKASDGSKIGNYSTRPAYYNRDAFVRKGSFRPVGKTGKTVFANGKAHRSMYLPNGYLQLRSIQGRRTDTVNLQYSGDMVLDYQQQVTDTSILIGFTKKLQSDKRKGNEKRFGKPIFKPTTGEISAYNKECAQGYEALSLKILGE